MLRYWLLMAIAFRYCLLSLGRFSSNSRQNSGGKWMALLSSGPGPYVEYTLKNVPVGTYDLWMKYKSHPGRGILSMRLDGAPIGPATLENPRPYLLFPSTQPTSAP